MGHHQQLQAEYGNYNSKGHHAPDGNHPHAQPLHPGQAEVGDTLEDAVIADGAEVPQSKELPPRKEPAAVADGDGGQDHGYCHAQDDQAPDERLKEGFLWSPVRQQPLRLKGEREEKNKTALTVLLQGEMEPEGQSCGIQYLKIFTCAHQTPSRRGHGRKEGWVNLSRFPACANNAPTSRPGTRITKALS